MSNSESDRHRRMLYLLQGGSLLLGTFGFVFVGWRYNVPVAAWISTIFLVRFFRDAPRWHLTLAAIPLLAAASYLQLAGGWDLDPWQLYLLPLLRPAVLIAALYADRWLAPRLPTGIGSLVFPAFYTAFDFAFSWTPFGTILSIAATQYGLPAVAGVASVAGIWGIGFLITWTASIVNLIWEHRFRLRDAGALPIVYSAVLALALIYGGGRAALVRPTAPTVRVASVTVPHPRDYWNWIDAATPPAIVRQHLDELQSIEDRLFRQSERAAAAGAKIIFWSEGNAVTAPERSAAFDVRAADFAQRNGVYLAAAQLQLHYGSTVSDNKVAVFTPDGTKGLSYVKTMSWYPTGSDGVLRTIDTPYGRLGTAICFDMDFPGFINTLGRERADIVLVPSYDSAGIRPYHTEVGLMRAIENGFSVVRQTNEGTSMAVDGLGHILARQEFFETSDPLMFADVPIRRARPIAAWGVDWLAYTAAAVSLILLVMAYRPKRRDRGPTTRSALPSSGR